MSFNNFRQIYSIKFGENKMTKKKITYWRDSEFWLGFINEYPEYVTQGYSLEELLDNLKDINHDLENELIPGKRKEMELEFA